MINEIRLRSFSSQSGEDEEVLSRDPKQNSVEYEGEAGPNTRLVNDVAFNKKVGVLTFIRANGEILEAGGFLTEDQIGHGEKGKIGRQGKTGRNGEDGRLGKDGPEGCAGIQGNTGEKGRDGKDGVDGPTGIQGTTGCEGAKGPQGDKGDKGPTGYQGSMGKNGLSCIVGCPGPIGVQGKGEFVVQTEAPTEDEVYLWGVPYDGTVPPLPDGPDAMTGTVNPIVVSLVKSRDTTYTASGSLVLSNFKGGVGPFVIQWTGDYKSKVGITKNKLSMDSLTLTLDASTQIAPGASTDITGNAVVTVTDTSNGKQLTIPTTYAFTGSNGTVVQPKIYAQVQDAAVVEGDTLKFLVAFTSALTDSVRATYTLHSGTAGTSDYQDLGVGYLDLNVGTDQFYIDVKALLDNVSNESIETMTVQVSIPGVSELNAGDLTGTGSITEAISHVVPVSVGAVTVTEGNTASVKVTLSGSYVAPTDADGYKVKYRTVADTASSGDFVAKTGTITFTGAWQEQTISINTVEDSTDESTEKFFFELYDAGIHLDIGGATKRVTVSIADDDTTYSGGGGGCIAWGSEVITPEGTKPIEQLLIGDTILGYAEPSLPASANSTDPDIINWRALELDGKRTWVTVVHSRHDRHNRYKIINDLSLTFDHPVLFKREGLWQWGGALVVIVGDIVLGPDGQEIPVTVSKEVYEELKVVELDVEPHDVYYANGILVHNAENALVHK